MFPPHCQKCFAEPQIVKVVLPVGDQSLALNARVSLGEFPELEGFFPPNKLPMARLEAGKLCFIHCKSPQGAFTIGARVVEILDQRRLRLTFVESSPPQQQRQHFRVETQVFMQYWPLEADCPPHEPVATQVNLSAGGIRFPIAEPLDAGRVFAFVIALPEVAEVIHCEAEVVRMVDVLGEEHAAFQFTHILPPDQEILTRFCLAEQRRLLREKVHTRQSS
jgi:hypothetical protein